jgi:hypothetical protein
MYNRRRISFFSSFLLKTQFREVLLIKSPLTTKYYEMFAIIIIVHVIVTKKKVIYKYNDDLNLDNYFQTIVKLIVENNNNIESLASLTAYEALPLSVNKESSKLHSIISDKSNNEGDLTKEACIRQKGFKGDGFIEFIPNQTLFDMYTNNTSFETHFNTLIKNGKISIDILNRELICSCAGYAALNFIFGFGDRHLRNILLRENSGKIFHIDFGYLFRREPSMKSFIRYEVTITRSMWEFLSKVCISIFFSLSLRSLFFSF